MNNDENDEGLPEELDLPEEFGPFDTRGYPLPNIPNVRADGVITPYDALVRVFENALDYLKRCPPGSKLRKAPLPPYDSLPGETTDGTKVEAGDTKIYALHREQVIEDWQGRMGADYVTPSEDEIESLMQMSCLNRMAIKCFAEACWMGPQDLFEVVMLVLKEDAPGLVNTAAIPLNDLEMAHRMGILEAIHPDNFMGDAIQKKFEERKFEERSEQDEDSPNPEG